MQKNEMVRVASILFLIIYNLYISPAFTLLEFIKMLSLKANLGDNLTLRRRIT